MQIKIHNLSGLPMVDYRTVSPLQGELKDLSEKNAAKLKRVLRKRGFTVPLKLWFDPSDGQRYLLDSHQTQRVLIMHDMNNGGSYDVPYVQIPGKNITEAKEELLEIGSQYGHATVDGLDEYLSAAGLELEDLNISFEGIDLDKFVEDITEEPLADMDKPKVKKYSVEELAELAKSKWPKQPVILEFINWLSDRD